MWRATEIAKKPFTVETCQLGGRRRAARKKPIGPKHLKDCDESLGNMARFLQAGDYEAYMALLQAFRPCERAVSQTAFKAFVNGCDRVSGIVGGDAKHVCVIPLEDGTLAATATLCIESKLLFGGSRVGRIEDVCTLPTLRHKGMGSQVVRHALALARMEGCYKVVLACDRSVLPFYSSLGFEQRGCNASMLLSSPTRRI